MTERSTAEPDARPGALEWTGIVLLGLCGALASLLECLLVPYYIGSAIVPVAVVCAFAGNIVLPRMAHTLVPTKLATAVPFVTWVLVIIGFGLVARPEGDVILPGGNGGVQWVTYGVLLGGALVGTVNLVILGNPPPARSAPQLSR